MPAATAPLGKPSAASKPTGFTKPAGLSRQTGSAKAETEEEEGEKPLQPVHIGISAVALLLSLLFVWTAYQADQVPNRVSDYLFGQPSTAADNAVVGSTSSDDEDEDSSADDEDSEEEEDEDEDE